MKRPPSIACMCGSLESTEEKSSVSVDRSRVKVKNTLPMRYKSYVATKPDSMIASCFMNVGSGRGLGSGLDNPLLLPLFVNVILEGLDLYTVTSSCGRPPKSAWVVWHTGIEDE